MSLPSSSPVADTKNKPIGAFTQAMEAYEMDEDEIGEGWDVDVDDPDLVSSPSTSASRPVGYHEGIRLPAPERNVQMVEKKALEEIKPLAPVTVTTTTLAKSKGSSGPVGGMVSPSSKAKAKAEREAELNRKREERRQRMQALRESKRKQVQ